MRKTGSFLAVAILLGAIATADIPPRSVTQRKIGKQGGTVEAQSGTSIAGARVVVPAGAVQDVQTFNIFAAPDQCRNLPPGIVDVGAPVDFLPIAVSFDRAVTLRIPVPVSYQPFFSRYEQVVRSPKIAAKVRLFAMGDHGWAEVAVARRSETFLEVDTKSIVEGCFIPVIARTDLP